MKDIETNMKLKIELDLNDIFGNDDCSIGEQVENSIKDEIHSALKKYLKHDLKFKKAIEENADQIVAEFDQNISGFVKDIKKSLKDGVMKQAVMTNKIIQQKMTQVIIGKLRGI